MASATSMFRFGYYLYPYWLKVVQGPGSSAPPNLNTIGLAIQEWRRIEQWIYQSVVGESRRCYIDPVWIVASIQDAIATSARQQTVSQTRRGRLASTHHYALIAIASTTSATIVEAGTGVCRRQKALPIRCHHHELWLRQQKEAMRRGPAVEWAYSHLQPVLDGAIYHSTHV